MSIRIAMLLLLLPFVWAILLFDVAIFTGGDNAYYMILAKSIALERAYCDISAPGSPPATHFPPLLPLMLSPIALVFGHLYVPYKVLILLFFGASLVATCVVFRTLTGRQPDGARSFEVSLLLPFAYGFNLVAVEHSHYVLSEIPYIVFSAASIFLFMRYLNGRKYSQLLPSLVLSVLTFHLRTIGFTLILAELLVLLLFDRRAFAVATGFCAVLSVPWTLRNIFVSGSASNYVSVFMQKNVYAPELGTVSAGDLLGRLSLNSKFFATRIYGELLISKNLPWFFSAFLLAVTLVGMGEALRIQKLRVVVAYLVFYNLFLLSWHWYDSRYALPVLPLFLFALCLGARKLSLLVKRSWTRWLPTALLIVLLLPNIHSGAVKMPKRWEANSRWRAGEKLYPYSDDFRNYFSAALFAKSHTPETSVFCARKPSLFYWFSERKCLVYPYTTNPQAIWSFLRENDVDYVVLDTFFTTTTRFLLPALVAIRDELDLVYETPRQPKVQLLEVKLREF